MTCKQGHEFTGDENYRARQGKCPVCFREVQRRYNHSEKGADCYARYNQSPKGWLNALHKRRSKALMRRNQRQEAEDLG